MVETKPGCHQKIELLAPELDWVHNSRLISFIRPIRPKGSKCRFPLPFAVQFIHSRCSAFRQPEFSAVFDFLQCYNATLLWHGLVLNG
jgi:hypothetical protein